MNAHFTTRALAPSTLARDAFVSLTIGLLLLTIASCDPVPEMRSADWGDLHPPTLVEQSIETSGTIRLTFDEDVEIVTGSVHLEPGLSLVQEPDHPDPGNKKVLSMSIGGNAVPGAPYTFEISVADSAGNDIYVVLPFYGPNAHPAKLLMNEVLTKSSANNRDAIEFLVIESGDLGGLTCAIGMSQDFDARYIFPSRQVSAGEFVIVHCKPEGIPEEKDEVANKTQSGGKNASPAAWDFWMRDSTGLPDTSGIVTLARTPMGPIDDALFYTDKVSEDGKDYRSFGTKKLMDRADALTASKAWKTKSPTIVVEDGANSTGCTATRTMCRNTLLTDTNAASDWHIVPSGSLSLGAANTNAVYVGP